MNKKTVISICAAMIFSFIGSSALKVYVKNFSLKVDAAEHQAAQLKQEVRVLHAEVAHLSNTDRIGRLAKVHLKMDKVKPHQVAYLCTKQNDTAKGSDVSISNSHLLVEVGWRYKSRGQILKMR
jgi:cell division protein FtsL